MRARQARTRFAAWTSYSPVRAEILASALALVLERKRQGKSGALITRHTVTESGPASEHQPSLAAPLHVLLAEDNLVNQKLARKMLEDMGATLVVAEDGFQCECNGYGHAVSHACSALLRILGRTLVHAIARRRAGGRS